MDNKLCHRFDTKRMLDNPPGLGRRGIHIKVNRSVVKELSEDNINMSPTAFNQAPPSHDIHDIDKSRYTKIFYK